MGRPIITDDRVAVEWWTAKPVGATTLDTITTTALANLLVAITSGKLPNVCLVLTDLRGQAYGSGSGL